VFARGRSKNAPTKYHYDAFAMGIFAAFNIFSMKIPYPVVGSLIRTCVTAPTSLPFWMMGLPLTSVVKKGQQLLTDTLQYDRNRTMDS